MPSSPNYQRDYKQEYKSESSKRRQDRAKRNAIHRAYVKANGPVPAGNDLDHRKELGKGGPNKLSNIHPMNLHKNRSYPRTSKGRMK